MNYRRALSTCLALGVGAWAAHASAIEPIPATPGWRGFVVLGVGHTDLKSNLAAGNSLVEVGRETINSVADAPRTDSVVHPIFTGEINYTTADRWQFFLGTSLEDALTLDGAVQLGVRRELGAGGILQGGFLFSGVQTQAWEDPYAERVVRKETDRDSTGARLQWDSVLGSPFQLTATYRDISLGKEASGQGVRSVACNVACRDLLRRDGAQYSFEVSHLYKLGSGPRHLLRPAVRYNVDDRDGAAVSSDSWSLQLSHVFLGQGYTVASNIVYGQSSFDQRNPIFGAKTDSNRFVLDTTVLYRLPIAGGRWQAVGSVTWGKDDSDVRFHEGEMLNVSVGAMYRFGS